VIAVAMNITKITQLAGVRYLLNTVATGDRPSTAQGGMSAYYTAAGTPPGRWWGAGAAAIGLSAGQPVTHDGAEALFSRFAHPVTGAPLGQTSVQLHTAREQVSANTVSGFDLTFRIPKSVSVLWGTADEATQVAILAAHHEAIDQALSWVQDEVLCTRSGRGGVVSSPVVGMVAARFDHWDTREGDPHLHSHVVVANRVQRAADGKWMTVDGASLYRSAVAASELHENVLLDVLHERLGLTFTERARTTSRATKSVVLDVDGVPAEVVEKFSARAAQIQQVERDLVAAWSAEHDGRAPGRRDMDRIHQKAWAATRRPKDKTPRPLGELVAGWREQLRTLGHDPAAIVAGATGHDRQVVAADRVRADAPAVETFARRLLEQARRTSPSAARALEAGDLEDDPESTVLRERAVAQVVDGALSSRATWSRANLRAEAERLTRMVRCARGERAALIDAITDLAVAECVPLTPQRYALPEAGRDDPRVARTTAAAGMDDPLARRFTHRRVLDAEAYLRHLATAPGQSAPHVPEATARAVLDQVRTPHPLAEDQAAAALAATTDPATITAVVGPAGTGKTTTMAAVRSCWEAEHGPGTVVGLATSARAAAELSAALGVQAHTVAKMLWETSPGGLAARAERRENAARMAARRSPSAQAAGARLLTQVDADAATYQVRPGQLVIVDEASMTGTFDLAQLARQVESAGAKMLLVGDPAQLDAPAAGGMLGWLDRTGHATQLTSVWRFHEKWEAQASLALRTGDVQALVEYEEAGRLRGGSTEDMLESAYSAVLTARAEGRSAILIAATNDQVDELNTRFTLDRRAAGDVDTTVLVPLRGSADAGVGEVILARKVDRTLRDVAGVPIRNGDLLTVMAIGPDGSVLAERGDESRARITLPATYLTESVELGYATTAHRAQGVTVDEGHLAIAYGERMTRELTYVAMTRGRSLNIAWVGLPSDEELRAEHQVVTDRPTPFTVLARALAAETAERTAHETAVREHDQAHNLGRLVAEYEYLSRWHHGPTLHAHLVAVRGQNEADAIAASPAWDALVATAARARAVDPARTARLLALPIARPEPDQAGQGVLFGTQNATDTVLDPAAILQHRLHAGIVQNADIGPHTPGWVAGVVPELTGADPVLSDLASQCAALITARIAQQTAALDQEGASWLDRLSPRPTDPARAEAWQRMVTAVAVYRDTYQVAGPDPLGPRPRGADRRRDRDWQRVTGVVETWDHDTVDQPLSDPWPDTDPWADVDWPAEVLDIEPWTEDLAAAIDDLPPEPPEDPFPEPDPEPVTDERTVERIAAVNAAAWDLWQSHAADSWVTGHLTERGLHPEAGHAPAGWTTTLDALRARGISDDALLEAGLATRASTGRLIDRFRDRLALPIRDGQDRIIAFTARANPEITDPAVPKYLNTSATEAYDKSAVLYGLDAGARRRLAAGATPVLLEGAMDVAAVRELATEDLVPVASCGTSVTAGQLDELRRAAGGLGNLIVATDPDTAGAKAAEHVWQLLSPNEAATAGIATMPDGQDPADLVKAGALDTLRTTLTRPSPLTHAVIDAHADAAALDEVEGRIAFVRQMATRLRRLPPEAVIAATDHLQAVVGDGLMPSTILAEVVNAYTPVQARPDDYDLSDVELDAYDAPQVDGMDL
jgi:DNA primase catalytic core